MAIREEVSIGGSGMQFILCTDQAGAETKLAMPDDGRALKPTLALLHAAGLNPQIIIEWNGDKHSRIGIGADEFATHAGGVGRKIP